ncbi:MAG: hypothetical protein K2R98_27515 [Gemmataceae bacterium]|nr:hypothetical protein [Gemmataceae bacterium]
MRPLLSALAVMAALAVPVRAADVRHFNDAALNAVQFVDRNEGWAVGDEGVVWHTIDGGDHWERQPTAVRASLRAVHFLNPYTGWAVGREELPHAAGSVGVVLVTRDGGLKWQRMSANALPGLQRVHFFDDRNGIVAGDGSEQYPTGLHATSDGGRTWKPVAGPRCPSWLASDFQDLQTGALAGAWSRLATVRKGVLGAADVDTLGGRSVRGLQVAGTRAVAVGQGGLVLVSSASAGVRWGYADLRLPSEVTACLDFHAVACRGDHTWVAGRPGSMILHSADRGQTWQLRPTGQTLPLNGVAFLDELYGWAVGELGTVLATVDGGKSWKQQRQGGQRAAVLCIHARTDGVPFDAVSLLAGDEGYLTATLRVAGSDPTSASFARASDPQRLAFAMRQSAGAAGETLWQFPVPEHLGRADRAELVAAWDRLHGGHAADQLLQQLVLTLRMWQPAVVLIDGKSDSALDELVAEAVQEAYKRAADPKAFPEQIEKLGLQPCSVAKLYARSDDRANAPVVLDLMDVRPRLQSTARDYASAAAGIVQDAPPRLQATAMYRLVAARVEGAAGHRDLMQGIALAPGGTARRNLGECPEADAELQKAIRMRRNLQGLTESPAGALTDANRLIGQMGPVLNGLPDDHGAPAALAIANQFAQAGQWALAREAYLLMVDRYPAHPLSADAYRWLIRHNSSSEARHRQELGQFLLVAESDFQQAPSDNPDSPIHGGTQVAKEQGLALLRNHKQARQWYEGSLQIEPRLASFGGVFANDPAMQFCLQAAKRNLGKFDDARQWYTRFLTDHTDGPWQAAAAAELWLINRTGTPPKPVALCRLTDKRPHLDGDFADECWKGQKPLKFRNAVGKTLTEKTADDTSEPEYGTEAYLAYDKEFLYVAVKCRHPADRYVAPMAKRKRDEDLRAFDRVSVLLDLDRDYSTYFRLEVDQRGCLCEDCWGDKTWNPRWFVALRSEPTSWQVEIAIPLAELSAEGVTPGRAWACNLVRTVPGRGVQAWSVPADVTPRPEGMGLLLFQQDGRRPTTAEAPTRPMMPSVRP